MSIQDGLMRHLKLPGSQFQVKWIYNRFNLKQRNHTMQDEVGNNNPNPPRFPPLTMTSSEATPPLSQEQLIIIQAYMRVKMAAFRGHSSKKILQFLQHYPSHLSLLGEVLRVFATDGHVAEIEALWEKTNIQQREEKEKSYFALQIIVGYLGGGYFDDQEKMLQILILTKNEFLRKNLLNNEQLINWANGVLENRNVAICIETYLSNDFNNGLPNYARYKNVVRKMWDVRESLLKQANATIAIIDSFLQTFAKEKTILITLAAINQLTAYLKKAYHHTISFQEAYLWLVVWKYTKYSLLSPFVLWYAQNQRQETAAMEPKPPLVPKELLIVMLSQVTRLSSQSTTCLFEEFIQKYCARLVISKPPFSKNNEDDTAEQLFLKY